ncbi:MAG TPA: hypothetical protein VIY48_14965 [Candidatus Paceibacterota bacterium]|jgi:hypothetical protein
MDKIIIDTVGAWQLQPGDTFEFDGSEVTIKSISDSDDNTLVYITDEEGYEIELDPDEWIDLLGYPS